MYIQKRKRLGIFEEAVGKLFEIAQEEGFLIADISGLDIVLPSEMEAKLADLVGKRIGILRTDIPGKEYLLRVLPEREKTASMAAQNLCENEQILNYAEAI
jgi:hypothetical protein